MRVGPGRWSEGIVCRAPHRVKPPGRQSSRAGPAMPFGPRRFFRLRAALDDGIVVVVEAGWETNDHHDDDVCPRQRTAAAPSGPLRPSRFPSRTRTGSERSPEWTRCARRHADRVGKVARLSTARRGPVRNDARRLAADFPDEGSGGRAQSAGDPVGRPALDAVSRQPAGDGARRALRSTAAAVRRAGAVRVRRIPPAAPGPHGCALHHRRGALRVGVGPRFPPGLSPPAGGGGGVPSHRLHHVAAAHRGFHRDGHSGGSRRHRRHGGPARPGDSRRRFRSAQHLPPGHAARRRGGEAGAASGPGQRPSRPRICGNPAQHGSRCGNAAGGWHRGRRVPRGARGCGTHARAGCLRCRVPARRLRHQRLRDGDRSSGRGRRRPLRDSGVGRSLLSGDRPRGPRRTSGDRHVVVGLRRRGDAAVPHRQPAARQAASRAIGGRHSRPGD